MPDSPLRELLRRPAFRLYFGSRSASLVGDMLVPVALAFAVLDLTGSPTDLGLVQAANLVPFLVLALVGGVWADRLDRRLVGVSADLVRFASQGLLAVLLITGHPRLWELMALVAAEGSAWAFAEPAYAGLLPEIVDPADLQRANGLVRSARSIASVAGPAAAGVLVVSVGPGWAIGVDAVTFGVSASLIAAIRRPPAAAGRIEARFVSEIREGLAVVRARRWLWVMLLDSALWVMVVMAPFQVLGPVVAKHRLGGASAWATIVAAEGLGAVAGSAWSLRHRPARPLLVAAGVNIFFAPFLALLALAAPTLVIAAAAIPAGAAVALYVVLWQTAVAEHTPADALGRVTAVERIGSLGMFPIGLVAVGPVAGALGVAATLWIAVAWQAVSTVLIVSVPEVRGLRSSSA